MGEIRAICFERKNRADRVDDESDDNAAKHAAAEFAADADATVAEPCPRSKSNAKSTTSQCHIATKRAPGAASTASTPLELTATFTKVATTATTATANLPSNSKCTNPANPADSPSSASKCPSTSSPSATKCA